MARIFSLARPLPRPCFKVIRPSTSLLRSFITCQSVGLAVRSPRHYSDPLARRGLSLLGKVLVAAFNIGATSRGDINLPDVPALLHQPVRYEDKASSKSSNTSTDNIHCLRGHLITNT